MATPHPEEQDRIEIGVGVDVVSFFNPVLTWFDIDTKNKKNRQFIHLYHR